MAEGIPLRKTAEDSGFQRAKKKLLAKSTWFKKRKSQEDYVTDMRWNTKKRKKEEKKSGTQEPRQKTVLFIEQSVKGELATTIRTLLSRLAPTLQFGVKVVERTGGANSIRGLSGKELVVVE